MRCAVFRSARAVSEKRAKNDPKIIQARVGKHLAAAYVACRVDARNRALQMLIRDDIAVYVRLHPRSG